MKIAFPLIDKHAWRGGYNYLLNLFSAIEMTDGLDVQPVLFAGEDVNNIDLLPFQSLPKSRVAISRVFNRKNRKRRLIESLATGRDSQAERLFVRYGVKIVFENAWYFGNRFKLPVIAWLPDFQHRHLPKMFSRYGYWRREIGFRQQMSAGRCILLSSEDARRDLDRFYPSCRATPYVIRFAVEVSEKLLNSNPDEVRQRYRLPEHFFFLPNQFYAHKNHGVVLSALKLLKKSGLEFVVAASGNPQDPRGKQIIDQLKKQICTDHLETNFIFLGSIPYEDVVGLMRCTAALVNPSLFEGWSTTVEEAKAMGVPLILSDLRVHREQAEGRASFFKRRSATSMSMVLADCPRRKKNQKVAERLVRMAARQRRQNYAQEFVAMARQCFRTGL